MKKRRKKNKNKKKIIKIIALFIISLFITETSGEFLPVVTDDLTEED